MIKFPAFMYRIVRVVMNPGLLSGRVSAMRDKKIANCSPVWLLYRCRFFLKKASPSKRANGRLVYHPNSPEEGMGGQLIRWLSSCIIADALGLNISPLRFTVDSHDPAVHWSEFFSAEKYTRCEQVKSLGWGIPSLMQDKSGSWYCSGELVDMHGLSTVIGWLSGKRRSVSVFELGQPAVAYDLSPAIPRLKKVYSVGRIRRGALRDVGTGAEEVRVAIHVRRGDVVQVVKEDPEVCQTRWLELDYYRNVVQSLCALIPTDQIRFSVYSDDLELRGEDVVGPGRAVVVAPNKNHPEQSFMDFDDMVDADYLIMGKSSFSYLAALISQGRTVVPQDWSFHRPFPENCIFADNRGVFVQEVPTKESGRKCL